VSRRSKDRAIENHVSRQSRDKARVSRLDCLLKSGQIYTMKLLCNAWRGLRRSCCFATRRMGVPTPTVRLRISHKAL